MFGLVREWRLKASQKTVDGLYAQLEQAKERTWSLMGELAAEEKLREAAESEVRRLTEILTAHPVEAGPAEQPAEKPPQPAPPTPRMLTGLEVVERATRHRNIHNSETKRPS